MQRLLDTPRTKEAFKRSGIQKGELTVRPTEMLLTFRCGCALGEDGGGGWIGVGVGHVSGMRESSIRSLCVITVIDSAFITRNRI